MKQLTTFLFLLFSITSFSQSFCVEKNINPKEKAPCSIEGISYPYRVWLVQIGVYENPIVPRSNTFSYTFDKKDGSGGQFFVYYIDKKMTESEARASALDYQISGYCDAYPVPDPVFNIIYKEIKPPTKEL